MSDTYADPPAATPWAPDPPPQRRVKVGHLVAGLVFLGLAGTWALRADGTLGDLQVAVIVPVVLVVAGLIGLLALVVGNRRTASQRRHERAAQWANEQDRQPTDTDDTQQTDDTQPLYKEQ